MRHLTDNFVGAIAKMNFRYDALKDMLKEMFNRVTYASINTEYINALDELRKLKINLIMWNEHNEPEQWVQSKFKKEKWEKLNNNPIES